MNDAVLPPSESPENPVIEAEPRKRSRLFGRMIFALLVLAAAAAGALGGLLVVYSTDLPQVAELESFRPSSVTELYDDQGRIIGSFALQRRIIARYEDYPPVLRDAIISVEDKQFEKHVGINFWRVMGALYYDLRSRSRAQGASTLTMQLSRNLFLSSERTFSRKIQEAMLSIQIERRFTKEQIFTLYCNQIFLGHGVYGFEAGSQFYFNKPARDLAIEEAALLAGLPKAPGIYSPILNPDKALQRRNLVINAMLEDGKVTVAQATQAKARPIVLHPHTTPDSIAPYFVEEIRQYLEDKYGSQEVHESGLRVYTTLNLDYQRAAEQAVLDGLARYERRQGWKGRLKNVRAEGRDLATYEHPDWVRAIAPGTYLYALITDVEPRSATAEFGRFTTVADTRSDSVQFRRYRATITPKEMAWTARTPRDVFTPGDLAYVKVTALKPDGTAEVQLEQASGVQGALLAIDNATGDIKAMVGGRNFNESKFNRATQALRQVGSSFKPYVYTAAVDEGLSPDDVVLDAPVTFRSGNQPYTPSNYDGKFEGNISIRRAVAQSRNIPALKIAERVGIRKVIEYAKKFGVTSDIPPYLPIALGSAEVTLMEQTAAFSVFPNDGVRVTPRYIRKVTDYEGHILEESYPEVKDVISARTARVMTHLLRGVVQFGTGAAANSLKHPLAGKTGTTNDYTDAWFMGFSPTITCGVWVGFDEKKTLGNKQTGGVAALPIWIDFMKVALQGREEEDFLPAPTVPATVMAQKLDKDDVSAADEPTEGH